jgi:hypothetical protein
VRSMEVKCDGGVVVGGVDKKISESKIKIFPCYRTLEL